MNNILFRFVTIITSVSILNVSCVAVADAEKKAISGKPSTANGTAYIEERILFSSDHTISSMKPDGSDKRTIDGAPASFRISPDGRWMLVLPIDLWRKDGREVRLYDLQQASFRRLTFPEGKWVWLGCWWSTDSREIHMYSAVTDKGDPYDYSPILTIAKGARIDRVLTYHLDANRFSFQTYKDNATLLFDYLIARGPSARSRCVFLSPNGKYTLKWDSPDNMETYGEPCGQEYVGFEDHYHINANTYYDIVLVPNGESASRVVFTNNKGNDFGSSVYPITEFPWSPDSTHFVVQKLIGGLLRGIFLDILNALTKEDGSFGIYIIDRETLKWRFIAYGRSPYWFAKLPIEFVEQP